MPLPTPAEQQATYPVQPGGGAPLPTDRTAAFYQSLFNADKKWGPRYGTAYANFNKAHPERTPYENVAAFTSEIIAKGLGKVTVETTQLLGQIPGAAAKGGAKAITNIDKVLKAPWSAATAIPRFLSMLTNANLWIRVAEIAAGLILMGIGVNALFKGKPMKAVTNVASKVPMVVPI